MSSYTLHIQYVDRPAETRTFNQPKVTLGRDSGDIVLHDTQVSGRHGEISFDGSTLRYTDVGSTNGSFLLQGQRVANIELTPGIALRLGNSLITVQVIDAPNVAGKGRTVIAGPGMAPGFPAPMRPPGPAAPVGAIPRPGMPGMPMPAPPAAPPGGFAFAPTAQMQSPAMPTGMPAPPAPPAGFVPQPAGFAPPQPAGFAPQQPGGFAPQPGGFAPQPSTMAPPSGPPMTAPAPLMPSPSMPAPQTAPPQPTYSTQPPQPTYSTQPPQPTYSTQPPQPPQPVAPPPSVFPPQAPLAVATPPVDASGGSLPGPHEDGQAHDLVGFATGAWQAIAPQIVPAALITAILTVPMAVLGWFVLVILGAGGFGGVLLALLSLVQIVGSLILYPAVIRFVLGVHLGEQVDVRTVIMEQVAHFKTVAPNFLVFGLITAISIALLIVPAVFVALFLGQIFFVEGKRYIEAVHRNVELAKDGWLTILINVFVPALVAGLALGLVSGVLGAIPGIGGLLGMLARAAGQAILTPVVLMLCTRMYFDRRRALEGGDPEADARARLGAPALPAY